MKGSNPIIPPGADFDGARRGRSNMRMVVVVVVVVHFTLFAGILFNACKQKEDTSNAKNKGPGEMARIVQPQLAPLPEPEALPSPVPSLPTLPGSTAEVLPPLPPLGSSALPPIPESVLATEGTSLPKPASLSPTVQSATGTEHVIAAGDNFWTIGRKYGVSAHKIERSNPNVIPTRLKIGQKIIIPAAAPANTATAVPAVDDASLYTVKSGDTLGHIALAHKLDVTDIKTINNLNSDFIRIGQKLKLPVSEIPAPVLPSGTTLPPIPFPTSSTGPSLDPGTGLPTSGAEDAPTEGAANPSEN